MSSLPLTGAGTTSTGDYGALIIAASPLIYLPLDATYGVTDRSGNGRNGTGAGGVTVGGIAGPGHLTATDFDGVDDRVTTTYNPFTNATVLSYEGWANRDAPGAHTHTLLGASLSGGPQLWITNALPGNILFRPDRSTATGQVTWTNAWATDTAWIHWMLIFSESGDTAGLYLNGILVSSQASTGPYNATPGNLQYGTAVSTSDPFDGKQAHVAVYNGDQSALALSHYNAGIA